MEILFVAVGLWLLLACVCAAVLGGAVDLGDDLWEQAREQDESDWQWPRRVA